MNARTLQTLAIGASLLCLSACNAGGSSSTMPSNAAINPSQTLVRNTASEVTYPFGARNGRTAAQLARTMSHRAGWISPKARAPGLVYFSNLGANEVEIFKQVGANQQPMGTITSGVNFPGGLTVDSKGNLYVVNEGAGNVTVYQGGQTTPSITYSTLLSDCSDVAVAKDGTVYIANFNGLKNGWVTVYPQGNVSKAYQITDFGGGAPLEVALDKHQNLYVEYDINGNGSSAVNEYAPGATTGTNLNLSFQFGAGIQVDKAGNVIVVQQIEPSEILVFPPGQTQPSNTITLPNSGQPFAIAISKRGKALFAGDSTNNLAQRLAYPSGKFVYSIASGFENPSGVAVTGAIDIPTNGT
jgi:sugar lactone lactonase YvrE